MTPTKRLIWLTVLAAMVAASCGGAFAQSRAGETLTPHPIELKNGKRFSLRLPAEYEISVAAEGLRRVRFFAKAPDGRLFATDMYSLADNQRGAIYILEDFDEQTGKIARVVPYLENLRNPNSVAFHRDSKGQDWIYIALTQKLVRYKYQAGDQKPSSEEELLATYPDYGLNYKYGGWHLTRTIAFGTGASSEKLFITVGSSCNACEEKEEIRATLSVMDVDGKNLRILASGLRNAVGMKFVGGNLYLTNMGADHLGDDAPDDTMFKLDEKALQATERRNYGWPYCYFERGEIKSDPKFVAPEKKTECQRVPQAFAWFAAHGSPLGLEYFGGKENSDLRDEFLVALHGSGHKRLKRGYKLVRVDKNGRQRDFLTGFLQEGVVYGRPCDVLRTGPDAFLLTDDNAGVIYYVHRKSAEAGKLSHP